jgi:hypothetical protein
MDEYEKHTNIKQIREYVEFYYKSQSETFDRIDVRLIGVAGFSSVLLKFIDEFEKVSSLSLVLDVFSCLFFIFSVGCCFFGLIPRNSGFIQNPETIRRNPDLYFENPEDPNLCETTISDSIMNGAKSITNAIDIKATYLSAAIACLCLGALTTGSKIIIHALTQ